MVTTLAARSVSLFVADHVLEEPEASGRVLAVFEDVCDVVTAAGEVFALVTPRIGNGPLNVVVDAMEAPFRSVEAGAPVYWRESRVTVSTLQVELEAAAAWNPRPDWAGLRASGASSVARIRTLARICLEEAPEGSLLALMEPSRGIGSASFGGATAAQRALPSLRAGWEGDRGSLRDGTREMAGLGGGLTPSGDDFLTGMMLRAWLAHPTPDAFCRTMVEAAEDLTTTLSAAFLRSAGRGECDAPWHALLQALADGHDAALRAAAGRVLSRGATSGADALAGFLFMTSAAQEGARPSGRRGDGLASG